MRDDLNPVNIGTAPDTYEQKFFWQSFRLLEMFQNRFLSKGPMSASRFDADEIIVNNGTITLGTVIWKTGAGSPEGVVAAPVGSLYTRTDGGASTTLYVKQSGTAKTGWVAK